MKYLLLLIPFQLFGQYATIKLVDGTFINNIPSDKDSLWYEKYDLSAMKIAEIDIYHTPITVIDDSDQNKITYYDGANSSGWKISTNGIIGKTESNCNCSWSSGPWDSLVFKFTNGTRFEWWGESMSHHGKANVYFNVLGEERIFQGTIDTYSPFNLSPTLNWSIDNLDTLKVYKFFLIPTSGKNVASSGTAVVVQYLKLIKENGLPVEPPITPPIELPIVLPDTIYIKEYYLIQPRTVYDTLKL